MQKRDRWETRLAEYLYCAEQQRFTYGSFDCCLFVAGAVRAQTGVDVAGPFRGKYWDKPEADKLVQGDSDYIGDFAARVLSEAGLRLVTWQLAQRGDVALIPTKAGEILGIVDMNGTHVAVMREQGWGRFPLRRAIAVWTV